MQVISKPPLAEGEIYAGLIGNANGEAYHLILLPGDNDGATWQAQLEWAKSIGGDLPNRAEQAMLWADHRAQFRKDWYWSNETHHENSNYAWCQNLDDGYQTSSHKSYERRACAVRREAIE